MTNKIKGFVRKIFFYVKKTFIKYISDIFLEVFRVLKQYIVLDIETTGLSKYKHAITEIAAVKVKNNKIIKEFHTLINPEQKIPSFITRLTGINDEMVKDSPTIKEIMPNLLKFLGKDIVVAHNASFDYGFISYNAEIHAKKPLKNSRLCTRKLASRLLPDIGSKRLGNLCEHFNIVNNDAHRAMSDVLATLELFQKFHNQLISAGIKKAEEILEFESLPRYKCEQMLCD